MIATSNTSIGCTDPDSPSYGHHLSQSDIANLVAPPATVVQQVVAEVLALCPSCSIDTQVAAHGDVLAVTGPARGIAAVAGVPELRLYQHRTHAALLRPASPSLPHGASTLLPFVALVTGLQLPAVGAGSNDNPWPMTGMAAQGSLYFIVLPRCQDGSFASNATNMCNDTLAAFDVMTNTTMGTPAGSAPKHVRIPAHTAQCIPAVYFPGVFCTVAANNSVVDGVMNHIYVRSVFADDTTSQWAYYQGLTPTVWVDPATLYEVYRVPTGTVVKHANTSMVGCAVPVLHWLVCSL